jgi:hypothetical protein
VSDLVNNVKQLVYFFVHLSAQDLIHLLLKHSLELYTITVETGYTAGIWGHHEDPRYKLTVL